MIKSLIMALMLITGIAAVAWGEEDIAGGPTYEERVCYYACKETHKAEYSAIPSTIFMMQCMPLCLERIECDVLVNPPVCVDKEQMQDF